MSGFLAPLVILLLLVLLLRLRLGCVAHYDGEGPRVMIRVGGLKLRVFPREKKDKPPKKKKPPKEKKEKPPVPLGQKVESILGYAGQLLPVGLEAVKYFGKKLRVDVFHLRMTVGGPDPAGTAETYGKISAALGALWQPLTRGLDIKDGYAGVDLDFDAPETRVEGALSLSLRLGQILWLALYFGLWGLKRLLTERSRQKRRMKTGEKGPQTSSDPR